MQGGASHLRLVSYSGMGKPLPVPPAWEPVLEEYAIWLRAAGRPESTVKMRRYQIARFARTTALAPFAATLDELIEYMGMHSWSPDTKHAHRSALRSFYSWGFSTGRIDADITALLPKVRTRAGKPRPAAEDVVSAALVGAEPRVRLMVALAAQAGLRCREIALVHRRDVERDILGWSLRVHGKGNKERMVPLPDVLAHRLHDFPGYVFEGQIDGHLSPSYVSKLVSAALPEGVTAHMLRHRFASRAYSLDHDIRAVQELLGHSSVATTQIYTAVATDALRRAAGAAA